MEKSIGLVFINSKAPDLEFAKGNVEREFKNAVTRMKNFWRVDELELLRDPTKKQVEEAFEKVKQSIVDFNNN